MSTEDLLVGKDKNNNQEEANRVSLCDVNFDVADEVNESNEQDAVKSVASCTTSLLKKDPTQRAVEDDVCNSPAVQEARALVNELLEMKPVEPRLGREKTVYD